MEGSRKTEWLDNKIIDQIIKGRQRGLFDILYDRYYQKVFDKCFGLIKNRELAEDFTQDILFKSFEKLEGFKGESSFSSWLYAITYNYCIDYLRENKDLHYPDWNNSNELPEIIDEAEEDLTGIRYERLLTILEHIHTEEKALLIMKYQDGLSVKEIAAALRITDSAAKMRLKRAKARVLFLYKKMFAED